MTQENIAVVGLGYVGLPLAVALAKRFEGVVGFDINKGRIEELRSGHDSTRELEPEALRSSTLSYSWEPEQLKNCSFVIVTVPTPVTATRMPDLTAVRAASATVGRNLKKGAVVVYESTVYPGVTEDICRPILERESGLKAGVDFTVGYSPERINPGDKLHTIEKIKKVVAAEDEASLQRLVAVYGAIIEAGIHPAESIKVAEAAKVIENTQRDLNIALMNELALIFERLGLRTADVLAAARTKWNFLDFRPGLVGGHCIGVDPYYLTAKAQEVGYHPHVILAGRETNDGMGAFIARKLIKMMSCGDSPLSGRRVAILGLTFKENVPDIRNSKVPDIIDELKSFGIEPLVHDPFANAEETMHEYGVKLTSWDEIRDLDGVVLAVAHQQYVGVPIEDLLGVLRPGGAIVDVKSVLNPASVPASVKYWSL